MKAKRQRIGSFDELIRRRKIRLINDIRSCPGLKKRQFPNLFIKTTNNEEGD